MKDEVLDKVLKRLKENVAIVKDNSHYNNDDDEVDDLVDTLWGLIRRKVLVPVICGDMFEYVDPITNEVQNLHSFMMERVINRLLKKRIPLVMTEKELEDIVSKGYFGTSVLENKANRDIAEEMFKAVVERDNNIYENIGLKPEVKAFLDTCQFPLIVTTCCFPIIEKELGADYQSYWSHIETKNDRPLPEYCIYHVFGEAKPESPNWVYNEKQMLRFVRSANTSEYALSNLSSIIDSQTSHKTLLILGNDCPDWLFRFILPPIYGGDVYDDKKGYYMNDKSHETDDGLRHFLHDIKFEKESQMVRVLDNITRNYGSDKPVGCVSHHKKHDIFISYRSADKDKLEKLIQRLEEDHDGVKLDIWYDKKPENGIKDGHYWEKIIKEMKDSAYFVPFITENFMLEVSGPQKRKDALEQLGITSLMTPDKMLTPNETWNIADKLSPVQAELMLASRWLELNPQKVYCIPIISTNETIVGNAIIAESVDAWGNKDFLPKNLFKGCQAYMFDPDAPQNLTLDWKRYKSLITIAEL